MNRRKVIPDFDPGSILKTWIPAFAGMTILVIVSLPLHADPPPVETPGLSLNFQNTDIDVVLKFFSDVTGQVFIKSDLVRGFVTVMVPGRVSQAEAMDILQSVLDLKGFTLVKGPGRTVKVLSQAEAVQSSLEVANGPESLMALGDRMVTQVIPLRFMSAEEVKNKLTPLLSKGGNLISDERMNSLIVTDMASNIQRLTRVMETLDVRSPQVLIEALIVEVSLTKETKLGLEWSYKTSFDAKDNDFSADLSQNFSLGSFITEGFKYSILRSDQRLSGLIQLLQTDKNVNILSTPHVMTLNNQPATIRVGEEVPVLTQTRNIQGGETIRSFDYKPVAIELEVTPRINKDREVLLKVHPLVKKILGFNAELNAPILATREASTSVLVSDGQTVVIGGLMKDDRSINQSKIPILGDIPLLGLLFRKKGETKEKTELLVFITPRVVLNPDEAHAVTVNKERNSPSREMPHKKDARQSYRDGMKLYKAREWERARREFENVLRLDMHPGLSRKSRKYLQKIGKRLQS